MTVCSVPKCFCYFYYSTYIAARTLSPSNAHAKAHSGCRAVAVLDYVNILRKLGIFPGVVSL